jgi:predicted transglutaminase-like cysteine proteinase
MKIVVLQDINLGVAHAILVVKYEGRNLVLDNQIGQVVDATRIRHYRPIYSVNEMGWWRHKR